MCSPDRNLGAGGGSHRTLQLTLRVGSRGFKGTTRTFQGTRAGVKFRGTRVLATDSGGQVCQVHKFREACSFGPAWNDPTDVTGCDARNRVLSKQLRDVVFKDGTRNCKVIAGWLQDPYSGERVDLRDVELDHTVALHRAWNAGAWQWDSRRRQIFANDPMELRALSSSVNRAKSDAALDEWMPPLPEARCPFVIDYLSVMVKYELPITVSERDAAAVACATAPLS